MDGHLFVGNQGWPPGRTSIGPLRRPRDQSRPYLEACSSLHILFISLQATSTKHLCLTRYKKGRYAPEASFTRPDSSLWNRKETCTAIWTVGNWIECPKPDNAAIPHSDEMFDSAGSRTFLFGTRPGIRFSPNTSCSRGAPEERIWDEVWTLWVLGQAEGVKGRSCHVPVPNK